MSENDCFTSIQLTFLKIVFFRRFYSRFWVLGPWGFHVFVIISSLFGVLIFGPISCWFFKVFSMVWGRFFGSILGVISHKFRIKYSTSFSEAFWRHFTSMWEPFGAHLGSFLVSKWLQNASRSEKRDFHENLTFLEVFLWFWGSEGTKIQFFLVLGATFSTSETRADLFMDFWGQKYQTWVHFESMLGAKSQKRGYQKLIEQIIIKKSY